MSYYNGRYRRSANAEWGEIFGLKIESLTYEQLRELSFHKLMEFLEADSRIEKIAAEKLNKLGPKKFEIFLYFEHSNMLKYKFLMTTYNDVLRTRRKTFDSEKYHYHRTSFIHWGLLDESNRHYELQRWIDGKPNTLDSDGIDFSFLYKTYPDIAQKTVDKVIKQCNSYSQNSLINLIHTMPNSAVKYVSQKIFELPDKTVWLSVLQGDDKIPEEYIVKALRVAAKRTRVGKVSAPITKSILTKLPTIMRLEALETLLFNSSNSRSIKFTDIKTEDDIKELLFGSLIRYSNRVGRVVGLFKRFYIKDTTTTTNTF